MKVLEKDKLCVKIYDSRPEMGKEAAKEAGDYIRNLLKKQQQVNIIFAAAPSQNEFLAALQEEEIAWERINAFHMDEYIGLPADAPQGFGNFLKDKIFSKISFGSVHYMNGQGQALQSCEQYAQLLKEYPADIVFMGIGENGHIAFNDPHVADFNDKDMVKVVDLDQQCRQQQVNDACFATIDQVPTHAMTLTIPALFAANKICCIVPAPAKANAVKQTVEGSVSEVCPASILRKHQQATLYLDTDSASLILS